MIYWSWNICKGEFALPEKNNQFLYDFFYLETLRKIHTRVRNSNVKKVCEILPKLLRGIFCCYELIGRICIYISRRNTNGTPVQWSWVMSVPMRAVELPTYLVIVFPQYIVMELWSTHILIVTRVNLSSCNINITQLMAFIEEL